MERNKNEKMSELFYKFYGVIVYALEKDIKCCEDVLNVYEDICITFYSRYSKEEIERMTDKYAKALMMKMMKDSVINYIKKSSRDKC